MFAAAVLGLGAVGTFLNREGKASRQREIIRGDIPLNEVPNGPNIYGSDRYNEVDLYVRGLSNENYRKSKDPINTNIIPPLFNMYYNNGTGVKMELPSNDTILARDPEKVNIKQKEEEENLVFGGPMFAPETFENFKSNQYSSNIPISDLTGEPLDMRHGNQTPFFGSSVKQNTDPTVNEHILEKYTGTGEIINRHKEEAGPRFQLQRENIYGTQPLPEDLRKDRFYQSNLKTNILPAPQVRVIPLSDTALDARGTFKTVDELRVKTNPKITYAGRTNPQKYYVDKPQLAQPVYKNRPETAFAMGPERYFTTTGAYSGPKMQENFLPLRDTARSDTRNENYFGVAEAVDFKASKPRMVRQNPYEEFVGSLEDIEGSVFDKKSKEVDSIFSEPHRVQFEADSFRHAGVTEGSFINDFGKPGYRPPEQERETTQNITHQLNVQKYVPAQQKHYEDKAKGTGRQIAQSKRRGNIQTVDHNIGGYKVSKYWMKPTHKQNVKVVDYKGAAGKHVSEQYNRNQYANADIHDRKEVLLESRTNGPEKAFNWVGPEDINMKITTQASEIPTQRKFIHTFTPSVIPSTSGVLLSTPLNKLPECDQRLDPNIMDQLADNPFSLQPPCKNGKDPTVLFGDQDPSMYPPGRFLR